MTKGPVRWGEVKPGRRGRKGREIQCWREFYEGDDGQNDPRSGEEQS